MFFPNIYCMVLLGDKLREIFDKLSERHFITSEVIDETVKEIQKALISADVEISLIFELSKKIKELKGEKIPENIASKEYIIKRIYDILAELFGAVPDFTKIPKRILLCGLFGSGKTTTAIKLANYYKKKRFDVGIIAADTYRLAAYEQLVQFGKGFEVFGGVSKSAVETVKLGLEHFKEKDIIIVDSAGRNALDAELSKELKDIKEVLNPEMSFLVLSADIGQIALKQAKDFNELIGINGVILTKMDGSAKGGGALAACAYLKCPVYFIGNGEKIEDLQQFDSMRYLSQIMGYPDLQGLLEKVQDAEMDIEDIEEFNFDVYRKQLKMANKLGGITKIAKMLGFGKAIPEDVAELTESKIKSFNAMIDSMTPYERKHPECLNTSRLTRIAKGSGTKLEDVRLLVKQFNIMRETFLKMRSKNPEDIKQEDLQKIMQKQMQKKMKKKIKIR